MQFSSHYSVPETVTATMGLASKFALTLLNKNWKTGECDEAVVIFYSKEDGVVSDTQSILGTFGAIHKKLGRC